MQTTTRMAAGVPEGFDPRDEPLPFLSNFQDVFLSIGVIILMVGAGIFASLAVSSSGAEGRGLAMVGAGVATVILALAWFLSEVLVRQRRRILPGIILAAVHIALSVGIFVLLYGVIYGESAIKQLEGIDWQSVAEDSSFGGEPTAADMRQAASTAVGALPLSVKAFILALPVMSFLAALVYYRRFKLPFASALVGATLIGVVLAPIFLFAPFDLIRFSPSINFLSGLALLMGGVAYDMKDPERVTRFSGNGFWLHLFAAPMILSGALTMAAIGPTLNFDAMVDGDYRQFSNPFSVSQSVVTLIIIGVFAVISLLLNRRALVVSGLISAGIAIGVIVRSTGLGAAGVAATTLVALGAGILLLGIGWHAARRVLLTFVPSTGVFGRMFPRGEADG